jgi:secondary thiamine-phosphate synthase enzyme
MVYREEFKLMSNDKMPTFHNVTEKAKEVVGRSKIKNGIVVVYSHHTTCCVITQEPAFDMSMTGLETLQQDFVEAFRSFMPVQRKEGMYLHPGPKALVFAREHGEDARGCHNTDAHLRSALVGRSETVVLIDGHMDLGEFGCIYFIDFDQTRKRERTVQVQIIGE